MATHANTAALIYDWNEKERTGPLLRRPPRFVDESIRDGIQSPSVRDPSIEQKMQLVRLMDRMGIQTLNLGLPGAGKRAQEDVERLLRFIVEEKLRITANCAARTVASDITPIIDISQKVGVPIEVMTFIGSSPIRAFAEGWDNDRLKKHTHDAVKLGVDNGLPVGFVTEDTTRSHPKTLDVLFRTAIDAGAGRLVLCDTCGHATPDGVRKLIRYVKSIVDATNPAVGIDWHGHRDRGLGLANSLAALEAGATRVHACALGVGERAGNTEMDVLLVNLRLLGWIDNDLSVLGDYVRLAHKAIGVPLPSNYAVFGSDAFETGTGVHAAAVIKAFRKGDHWLANRVYSGVPADMVGLEQVIKIGPMSGKSNVIWFLEKHGVQPTDKAVDAVLQLAKTTPRLLEDREILAAARG
jgi:2-isopropylmalate synthase